MAAFHDILLSVGATVHNACFDRTVRFFTVTIGCMLSRIDRIATMVRAFLLRSLV
jgi:hypothetical protein